MRDLRPDLSPSAAGFSHRALIYSDADEFVAGALPFLLAGLEAGEAALVAVGPQRAAQLREALGGDAGAVRFLPMRELGRNPARIIPAWREFVDAHDGRPVRGVGEPVWPGRDAAELEECHRHEALLNLAFAAPPSWSLLCPYDALALDESVLRSVLRTHPEVVDGAGSPRACGAAEVGDCFAGELSAPSAAAELFAFDRGSLREVRSRVGHAARLAGLTMDRAADLVAAAAELAANSVGHGGGAGRLRIWPHGRTLLVEVEDAGHLTEPLAGRRRPPPTQERGRGLWLANQLCDLVQIRSGPRGTTVRLHATIGAAVSASRRLPAPRFPAQPGAALP